jgi:ribonuclease HII
MAGSTRRSTADGSQRPAPIARAFDRARRRGGSFAAPGARSGRSPLAPWHRERLDPDFAEEKSLWSRGYRFVAGLDEVGRGCLAGPVVAGAVILPRGWIPRGLRDSKLLTADERARLDAEIRGAAVAWAVAFVEPALIDRINILQATLLATLLAAGRLPVRPDALILDAVTLPELQLHQHVLVDADRLCASVAAASVVAKVARDTYMVGMSEVYPGYDLARNKGYAAPEHRAGLATLGPSPIHRRSFAPCSDPMQVGLWDELAENRVLVDVPLDVDVDAADDPEDG